MNTYCSQYRFICSEQINQHLVLQYVLCIMINHLCDICIYILCIVNILYFIVIPSLSLTWYLNLELSKWCHTHFSHAVDSHVSSLHVCTVCIFFQYIYQYFHILLPCCWYKAKNITSNLLYIYFMCPSFDESEMQHSLVCYDP